MEAQNFANHRKFVPLYHYVAAGLVALYLLWSVYKLIRHPSLGQLLNLGMAAALILIFFYSRVFALKVQDRVIRLEERLRLRDLADPALAGRIGEFSSDQLIGLRFASDEELPGLARRVLDESISDRDEIKKLVRSWRADHARA